MARFNGKQLHYTDRTAKLKWPLEWKCDKENLIILLDKFANDHHHLGFDFWVETQSQEEKLKLIDKCRNVNGALRTFIDWNWKNGIQYSAIQSENCALYDTGESSDKAYYDRIQSNAKQSKSGLLRKLQDFIGEGCWLSEAKK